MEARPFLRLLQRAIGAVAPQKCLLPSYWQECDPSISRASSPPPSPCDEIIVVGFKGEWQSSKDGGATASSAPSTNPAFNVV
jgi:hypothetical protein